MNPGRSRSSSCLPGELDDSLIDVAIDPDLIPEFARFLNISLNLLLLGGCLSELRASIFTRRRSSSSIANRFQFIGLRVVAELPTEGIRDDLTARRHPLRLGRPDLAYPSGRLRIDVRR